MSGLTEYPHGMVIIRMEVPPTSSTSVSGLQQQLSDHGYLVYAEPSRDRLFAADVRDEHLLFDEQDVRITVFKDLSLDEQVLADRGIVAAWQDNECTCPRTHDGYSKDCPMARSFNGGEPLGHVKECPQTGRPCPCLPGSIAQAYCALDAEQEQYRLERPAAQQ